MASEVGYSVFPSIWGISFSVCIKMACWCVCVCVHFYVLLPTCVDTVGVCPSLFLSVFVPIVCKCVCVKINQSGGDDEQFL